MGYRFRFWACVLLAFAPALSAPALTVTTNSDAVDGNVATVAALQASPGADGVISLREALQALVNDLANPQTPLDFAGDYTINLGSPLPAPSFENGLVISGVGRNIVIDGGGNDGLTFTSCSSVTVENLTLRNFATGALVFAFACPNPVVRNVTFTGNPGAALIHNNSSGLSVQGCTFDNNGTAIQADASSGFVVGGTTPGAGNVFTGNGTALQVQFAASSNSAVYGNRFGLDAGGLPSPNGTAINIFNAGDGSVTLRNVVIGGLLVGQPNIIANNTIGIRASGSRVFGHSWPRNSIYDNGTAITLLNGANQNILPPALTLNGGTVEISAPGATAVSLFADDGAQGATFIEQVPIASGTGAGTADVSVFPYEGRNITGISFVDGGTFTNASTFSTALSVPNVPPVVTLVSITNPVVTNAPQVTFTVQFSENVSGVPVTPPYTGFALDAVGVSGASIAGVSGSGSLYTVSVNTGTGEGTLALQVVPGGTIADLAGNLLDTAYTSGPGYVLDRLQIDVDLPPIAQGVVGDAVSFGIEASGPSPLFYQWYRVTPGEPDEALPGEVDSVLSFASVAFQDDGSYYVVVGDGVESQTSATIHLVVVAGVPAAGLAALAGLAGALALLAPRWRR